MRRFCLFAVSALLILSLLTGPALAAEPPRSSPSASGELIREDTVVLDDGWTVVTRLYVSDSRELHQKTASKTSDYYSPAGEQAASITISGTFVYDGSTVSVYSKSLTNLATYNGWRFSLSSFSSSGGTVTLTGTLKKALFLLQSVSMSLSCDANGNIS